MLEFLASVRINHNLCFTKHNKESKKLSQTMENKKRNDTAALTAQAHNCTASYVRAIVNGVRNSNTAKAKAIIETYNKLEEAKLNLSQPVKETEDSIN